MDSFSGTYCADGQRAGWIRAPVYAHPELKNIPMTTDATWRFNLQREPYTAQMVAVICYSTSSPNVTATFSVTSPVDPGSAELAGTATPAASSRLIVRVPVVAGDILSADATLEPFTCSVTLIASSDFEETAPTVTVWDVHWTTDRIAAADIT